jgi:hypothetical protein
MFIVYLLRVSLPGAAYFEGVPYYYVVPLDILDRLAREYRTPPPRTWPSR